MSKTRPQWISIEEIGLKEYLTQTKAEHDNKGYDDFIAMLKSELKYSKQQIRRAFKISRPTLDRWLEVYGKEGGKV